jgi:hypothetical protein
MAIAGINFSKEYMTSPITFHLDEEYRSDLKHQFIKILCGNELFDSAEIQKGIIQKIRHVKFAVDNDQLDRDAAEFIMHLLLTELVSSKLNDSLEKWSSKVCQHGSVRQFMLPGME